MMHNSYYVIGRLDPEASRGGQATIQKALNTLDSIYEPWPIESGNDGLRGEEGNIA